MPLPKLTGVEYFPRDQIIVGKRLRAKSAKVVKHIEELAESIKQNGPISPLILDEKNNLIAGGCRYEAYGLLGEVEVPVARRNKISPAKLRMLEVEENLRRLPMEWVETILGIYEVHEDATEKANKLKESWGTRATGSLLGVSHSHVADAVMVAKFIIKGDEEIKGAGSLDKAKSILLKRKEEAAVAARAAISATPIVLTPKPQTKQSSGIVSLTLGITAGETPKEPVASTAPAEKQPVKTVDLSKMLFRGDCIEVMKSFPKDAIDIAVTDIPYGIDMANLEDMHGIEDMLDTHDVEQNVDQMHPFLAETYRVLKPNSYLLFFYALQHHEKLRDWGRDVGFQVCDWPILWLKPHSCKNNAPHANPTKSFEPVMVMRKGKPSLIKPMTKCHLEVDGMADKRLQSNPFAKPLEFLNWMLSHYVHAGMSMLDPFAGEGSILRAGILNGCKPIGIELCDKRFPRLVQRVKKVYSNSLGSNTLFIDPS